MFNFYNVHYAYTHVVGTSGGNTDDMVEALEMMSIGLDPAGLVTHIGGLNAVIEATNHLPEIPGGKKLIYTHITLPLTPISEFGKLVKQIRFSNNWQQFAIKIKDSGVWKLKLICFPMRIN